MSGYFFVQSISFFIILLRILRAWVGYPTIMEKQKKARESTDLAEYIFLGTKNFEIGSVVKKLQSFEVGEILVKSKRWQKKLTFTPIKKIVAICLGFLKKKIRENIFKNVSFRICLKKYVLFFHDVDQLQTAVTF